MTNKTPKKFVGLHAHSGASMGDGMGLPKDHIDFAMENGMDALALTDHGHMNGFSHQYLYKKQLEKKGVPFKALYGCEAYFVNSLENWQKLYDDDREKKAADKLAAKVAKAAASKSKKKAEEDPQLNLEDLSDQFADTKAELDEMSVGNVAIEDEEESKKKSWQNPINKRNHLVLLPKNREGLYALYKMISLSYADGFYRYPRIDFAMLEKYAKDNIVASSACVAGSLASIVFENQPAGLSWEEWAPNDHNIELIQKQLKHQIEAFKHALGKGNDNFYLELQFNSLLPQHLVNQHLIEAAKRTNTPLVVTCDSHYARPELWREREIYKALAWLSKGGANLSQDKIPNHISQLKCELYPKNAEQVWQSYKETTKDNGWDFYDDAIVCDAIERTYDIAHDLIENYEPNVSVKLPSLKRIIGDSAIDTLKAKIGSSGEEVDEATLAFADLKDKAIKGLVWRKKQESQEYIDRLKEELKVVRHLKLENYFLTYHKVMELLGDKMLLGMGRGSAAGSLLSYVLSITQVDPIEHGLLFERFLVRNKAGMADIDSDVSDRDSAMKILSEYFGQENIVPVSNFVQLQMRSLIKDLSKFEGISFEEANEYTRLIEKEAESEARKEPGFDKAAWVLSYEEAHDKSPTFRKMIATYPSLENNIKVLFKELRGYSRHAGGIVITEDAFGNMPVIKSGGVLQTPWPEGLNYRHLESLGFLKFDILGLGTLRMIEDCVRKIIKKETGKKFVSFDEVKQWYYDKLHPDNNSMDDVNVYKHVYWEGNYGGIFQFINPPVQKFISQMKPRSVRDLAVATSLYRPGPLGVGAHNIYLQNRANPKGIRYAHPLLEEVLSDTCGLLVFQEQLQLIYHKLAGVPLDETDNVRKAFTKKESSNKEEAAAYRNKLREEFAEKCLAANQIEYKTSYAIFDDMEKMVRYSFNASHAVCYSVTSYQTAWLMTHYPDEWVTTYVDYSTTQKGKIVGKEDPKAVALAEVQAIGYTIGRHDINFSEREFTSINKTLIPSFASAKYCGSAAVDEIFENRPYKTIEDLLFDPVSGDWRHSKFNKRSMSTLVKIGGFESMGLVGKEPHHKFKNYRQLHHVLVDNADAIKRASARKKNKNHLEVLENLITEAQSLPDWTLREKIDFSGELTGSVDQSLVMTNEIQMFLRKNGIDSIDEWESNRSYTWAVVTGCSQARTKAGKPYLKLTVYGTSGENKLVYCWDYNTKKGDSLIKDYTLIMAKFNMKFDDADAEKVSMISCQYAGIETLVSRDESEV